MRQQDGGFALSSTPDGMPGETATGALGHQSRAEARGRYIDADAGPYMSVYDVTQPVARDELTEVFDRSARLNEYEDATKE